jgi:hypothetical protein
MTKVHRIVLCIVDHDDVGVDGVREALENAHYPNRCISPTVVSVDTRNVEWSDDHLLNQNGRTKIAFAEMFSREISDV